MRLIASLFAIVFLASCASQNAQHQETLSAKSEKQATEFLQGGYAELVKKNPSHAITLYFNPIITFYEKNFSGANIYCARTEQEANIYQAKASNDRGTVKILNPTWAEAYFLKAYAYVDLENPNESEVWLNKAISLSPNNSAYYSELAHVYQMRKDWSKSIELFSIAEAHAEKTSPPATKVRELMRAKRGIAFALVELGKLDAATQKYNECLEIDPEDQKSLRELEYIKRLKYKSI